MNVQKKFNKWLDKTFADQIPDDSVIGYYFAVYPTSSKKYSVVLYGNSKIYDNCDGWLVGPPFVANKNFTIGDWVNVPDALATLRDLLKNYMLTESYKVRYLSKAKAIVIGHLPGDIEHLKIC